MTLSGMQPSTLLRMFVVVRLVQECIQQRLNLYVEPYTLSDQKQSQPTQEKIENLLTTLLENWHFVPSSVFEQIHWKYNVLK